jgi:hypothetical protein
MIGRKNKKQKLDLLEMSDDDRIRLIREVKEKLRQKAVEEKLWKTFLESENLTINGETVSCEAANMKVFSINELLRSK